MAKRTKDEREAEHDEPAATTAATPERTVVSNLHDASCAYNQAVQQAWQTAGQDAQKVASEFSQNHQRLTLDAGARHSAAYQAWCDAMKDEAEADATLRAEKANRIYRDALTEGQKEGQGHWQQLRQTHQEAVAAVNEAYTKAAKEALAGYLVAIKEIWSGFEPDEVDAAALAKLAEATNYAASVAPTILGR